ncbi:hypothetical protein ACFW04_013731 [Cataglyphis niger]
MAIWCHKCLLINEVNMCNLPVTSALHSGLGWPHLQKLLACINIPCFQFKTFKKYEQEVECAAENVAKQSCRDAVLLEKNIYNTANIEKQL